jgi:hypothetical protein
MQAPPEEYVFVFTVPMCKGVTQLPIPPKQVKNSGKIKALTRYVLLVVRLIFLVALAVK